MFPRRSFLTLGNTADTRVHGGSAAVNRGADCVQLLVPALRARTRSWTGHRGPHNQTAFACEAHGAGQHRDYTQRNEMEDRPITIYKYENFNVRSLLNLKGQSLYFGSPREFNDPYDCAINATVAAPSNEQIEIVKQHYLSDPTVSLGIKRQFESMPFEMLKQQLINGANMFINDAREKFLSNRGVTCFSERNDDLLMWAHYGGQYKGFCLAFDTSKEPFSKLRKVEYVETIPQIDIVDFTVNKNHNKLLDDLLCTKSISGNMKKSGAQSIRLLALHLVMKLIHFRVSILALI